MPPEFNTPSTDDGRSNFDRYAAIGGFLRGKYVETRLILDAYIGVSVTSGRVKLSEPAHEIFEIANDQIKACADHLARATLLHNRDEVLVALKMAGWHLDQALMRAFQDMTGDLSGQVDDILEYISRFQLEWREDQESVIRLAQEALRRIGEILQNEVIAHMLQLDRLRQEALTQEDAIPTENEMNETDRLVARQKGIVTGYGNLIEELTTVPGLPGIMEIRARLESKENDDRIISTPIDTDVSAGHPDELTRRTDRQREIFLRLAILIIFASGAAYITEGLVDASWRGIAFLAAAILLGNTAAGILHQLLSPIPPVRILLAIIVPGVFFALLWLIGASLGEMPVVVLWY